MRAMNRLLVSVLSIAALATSSQAQIRTSLPRAGSPSPTAKQSALAAQSPSPSSGQTAFASAGSDICNTPDALTGNGPFFFDNTAATTGSEGQTNGNCSFFGPSGISNDVWFTWTANASGTAVLSLCGTTTMDSKVAVYASNGCPSTAALSCNDDSCGLQSQTSFACTVNNIYTIQLGNYPSALGSTGTFRIDVFGPVANDECAQATVISGAGPFNFDATLATTGSEGQANSNCDFAHTTGVDNDVWFQWSAPATGTATVSVCGAATFDSKIAIYDGASCPVNPAIACNDDACGVQSQVLFCCSSGSVYTIQIGSFPTYPSGPGSFTITTIVPGAGNDDCSTPSAISGAGPFGFNNAGATTSCEGQANGLCSSEGLPNVTNDLWFTWMATTTGLATVSTCGQTTVNTNIAVYLGIGCPGSGASVGAIACSDNGCASAQSTTCFVAVAGNDYTLQIGSAPGATPGPGGFTVTTTGLPTTCIFDDGVSDNSVGNNFGAACWIHRLGEPGKISNIAAISTAWGTPLYPGSASTNGTPATFAIWKDPTEDGDPRDCILVSTIATTVQNVDTDMFTTAFISPPLSVSGVFFIGACVMQVGTQYPAPLDQSTTSDCRAWFVGDTSGTLNYADLSANDGPPVEMDTIGLPGVWLLRAECVPGEPFCYGDGSLPTACPCGNFGAQGHGCANSVAVDGALLYATGSTNPDPITGTDTLVLTCTNMPATVTSIFLKGNASVSTGTVFGDGVRCAGGTLVRLGQELNVNGAASYPSGSQQSISIKGSTPPGSGITAYYQTYYRNASASFCPPATFNVSNGYRVTW